jgi:hypothetical protein
VEYAPASCADSSSAGFASRDRENPRRVSDPEPNRATTGGRNHLSGLGNAGDLSMDDFEQDRVALEFF